MKAMQILTLPGCSVLLALALSAAAQQQSETPYLDIQWNSELVRTLLSVDTGLCQADVNPDTAPVKSKYDNGNEWPRTLKPSVLRAMFYLAYDYYGMGLNHYFTLRQDLQPDFDKRFAAPAPQQYQKDSKTIKLVTHDYVAFKPGNDAKASAGAIQVAVKGGDGATQIHYRHSLIDPFDLSLLADQIHNYRIVGIAAPGQKLTSMDIEVRADDIDKYYLLQVVEDAELGKRKLGMRRTSAFWYPGTLADGRPDYSHYTFTGLAEFPEPVRAPYHVGDNFHFGEGMLEIDSSSAQHTLCAQWRMQQERERSGQATETDRLLNALMQRAGFTDENGGLWVIPAEGY